MKKILGLLVFAILTIVVLSGCVYAPNSATSPSDAPNHSQSDASPEPVVPTPTHNTNDDDGLDSTETMKEPHSSIEVTTAFTFRVNEHMPLFECATIVSEPKNEYGFGRITQITIVEADDGTIVQTIVLPDGEYDFNEDAMKAAAYFIDVTFDGNLDLLVPRERSARYISFSAFLWNDEIKQFVENLSFETVYNPSIDLVNKQILSATSGNETTSYSIIAFENNAFVTMNSFGWMPDSYEDDPLTMDRLIRYTEHCRISNIQTVVNDFCVLESQIEIDPQLKLFFEPESFWDLNNPKWQCSFENELKKW